jgi:hypothetical protein
MKPRTICHPEALADWRANDEDYKPFDTSKGAKERRVIRELKRENRYVPDNNTIPKKQSKLKGLLAQRLEEALEQETRKRGTVRKEREA